ncbi:hypothetical protein EJB05_53861, partial [Eragrostis curvula]
MEYHYQQNMTHGSYSTKEKRPPLKRGQLKRRIVRSISNLVASSNDGDRKFRREPKHSEENQAVTRRERKE